jgi:PAT family beta-lactamase induction signal transducer AmpG
MASLPASPTPRARWWLIAGLYLAQGIPSYLLIMAVPAALRAQGMGLEQVGLLSVLMLPVILKFLWAPWVDRIRFGRWGHRRGWILGTQLSTSLGIALLALCQPQQITAILAAGMLVALSIATQDIATDGYATQVLTPAQRPLGNGIQAAAVALGVIVGGTLSMALFEQWGWKATLLLMAALSLLPLALLPAMQEAAPSSESPGVPRPSLRHFLHLPAALPILGVALVYRLSEGMVRSMESSYVLQHGLRLSEAGLLTGSAAAIAGLVGSAVATRWLQHRQQHQVLLGLSGLRVLCYVLFALHAAGALGGTMSLGLLALGLAMLRYMEMVALYALFMTTASPRQPGTDFSILVCAELLSYMLSSMAGGFIAKQLGFVGLFSVASGLALLSWWLTKALLLRSRKPVPHG